MVLLSLLPVAESSNAAALRLTTWQFPTAKTSSNNTIPSEIISPAADLLKKIDPDVVILENVPDREHCQSLVDALKPAAYQVAVCSSFRYSKSGKMTGQQVAILTKSRAPLGWSEAWQNSGEIQTTPGGFAFAEIRAEGKNLALIATHVGLEEFPPPASKSARIAAAAQLLKTINSFQNWGSNRIDAVILAGDLQAGGADARSESRETFSGLVKNGFQMALDWLPDQTNPTLDYIFTRGTGPVANVVFSPAEFSANQPVTCDLSLDAPKPVVAKPKPMIPPDASATMVAVKSNALKNQFIVSNAASSPSAPAESAVAKPLAVQKPPLARLIRPAVVPVAPNLVSNQNAGLPSEDHSIYLWLTGVALAALIGFLVIVKSVNRSRHVTVVPSVAKPFPSESNSIGALSSPELSPAERAGIISQLTLWLKHRFVQKLVEDRSQLIATQNAAALAVMAMDERLTHVEKQIKQRNQEYEFRIEELLKELAVAQEENRELIRLKIEMLKLEMAKSPGKSGSFPSRN